MNLQFISTSLSQCVTMVPLPSKHEPLLHIVAQGSSLLLVRTEYKLRLCIQFLLERVITLQGLLNITSLIPHFHILLCHRVLYLEIRKGL